jgi:glutamine synthetase
LIAGLITAATDGILHPKESMELAEISHVTGDVHGSKSKADQLEHLPHSCCHSADIIEIDRHLYEEHGVFPPQIIDGLLTVLRKEKDSDLNERMMEFPDAEKLKESRKVMHRSIHKN